MTALSKIFISYRRADNEIFVQGIRNWLIPKYGRENVFMDFDGLRAFSDFQAFIEKKIAESDAVIVILGPNWLKLLKEKAASFETDYVRVELEAALKQNKLIAPIRILDAPAPPPAELPETLRPLSRIHAPVLNAGSHFLDHIEGLIADLEAAYAERIGSAPPPQPSMTAEDFYIRGDQRWRDGDNDGAIEDCNQAIALKPDYAEAFSRRGTARANKGDYDGAIADYNQAIRLKPDYAAAYYNRGNARYNKGNYDGAIADYTEAIRLKPDYAIAVGNRGAARYNKADFDGAIADHTEAIRLKPDDADAYVNRGLARNNKGDYDGAIADYNQAVRLKPDYADAYVNRGTARYNKSDLAGAIADWREALRYGNPLKAEIEKAIADAENLLKQRK